MRDFFPPIGPGLDRHPTPSQPAPGSTLPPLTPPKPEFPNGGLIPSPGKEISSLDFANIIGGPLTAAVRAQAAAAMTTVDFIQKVGFHSPPKDDKGPSDPQSDPRALEPVYVTFKYPKEVMPYQPAVPGGLISFSTQEAGKKLGKTPKVTYASGVSGADIEVQTDGEQVTGVNIKTAGTGWTQGAQLTVDSTDSTAGATQAVLIANVRADQPARPAAYETMALMVPLLTMVPVPYLRIAEMNLQFNVNIVQTEQVDLDTTIKFKEGVGAGGGGDVSVFTGSANFSASISQQITGDYKNAITRNYSMNVTVKAVQAEVPEGLAHILGILQASILAMPVETLVRN